MTPEQLEAIEGIGPKTVEKISIAVNNYFSSLEGGEAASEAGEGEVSAESAEEAPAEAAEGDVAEQASTEVESGGTVKGDETQFDEMAATEEPVVDESENKE
jgi:N utilization substance protein A